MPKRKKSHGEEQPKKGRMEEEPDSCESGANLTQQNEIPKSSPLTWSESDISTLLGKIEEILPKNDTVSYSTRLESLNWEEISFERHTAKECKEIWVTLSKEVRKYRLLGEILTDVKEWVSKPKAKTVLKHPFKPKQPNNSYMMFVEDKRQEITEQNPSLRPVDIARKLGQMFKELSQPERDKYEERAKSARLVYLDKLQAFYEEHPEMVPKKVNKRGKVVPQFEPAGAPVKPKTPFELFLQMESEKEGTDSSKFVMTQKCRERWNGLGDKEKYFWINWAEEQYDKYVEDLKEYLKIHPGYEPEKMKPILNKNERKIKESVAGKPAKPPHGAYQLYTKMIMESDAVQNINKKELMNYVSEKWRSCTDEEKNEYRTRVEQMWDEYERKLEVYLKTLPPEERDAVREKDSRKKNNRPENKATPEKKEEPKDKPKRPDAPPPNKYKYFVSVYEGDDDPSKVWETLSEKERETFEEKLEEERRKYIASYEKYLKSLTRGELEKLGASLGREASSSASESSDEADDD